jgi:aminoglycoside 3-N-acetyltransferase
MPIRAVSGSPDKDQRFFVEGKPCVVSNLRDAMDRRLRPAMTQKATVTRHDLEIGLRALGLKEGSIVGVHSSLSRFGYVEGGADTVIDALLSVVGESGSVVMPTYSKNREEVEITAEERAMGITWKIRILPYAPKTEPCWTGRIPDTFWRRKGVLRGSHRSHSLAAVGPRANELVRGWHGLLKLDGHILLLGITLDNCSAMHLAEEYVQLPDYIRRKITLPPELRDRYPSDQWEIGFGPYPDFVLMEGPSQERDIMKLARIGDAVVRMARLRELIDLYAEYLRRAPEVFYHGCVAVESQ